MLCDDCYNLIKEVDTAVEPGTLARTFFPKRHVTLDQFLASLNAKCYLCTRLRLTLGARRWQAILDHYKTLYRVEFDKSADYSLGVIFVRIGCKFTKLTQPPTQEHQDDHHAIGDSWSYGYSKFVLSPQESMPQYPVIVPTIKDTTSTGDSTVLSLLHHWLDTCLTHELHDSCRRMGGVADTTASQLPTRLLDLSPPDLPSGHWRLIHASDKTVSGPFMTLSHRWGHETFKLERETEHALICGMPVTMLPGTYRDAVQVVRRLGVRYFWIDSLCIFQDELLDIQREATLMAEVYGNSFCNISALLARSDGLFSKRDPILVNHEAVSLERDLCSLRNHYLIHDMDLWDGSMIHMPLTNRGWVLQEELLAPRTIYFSSDQVLWNCTSYRSCETYLNMQRKRAFLYNDHHAPEPHKYLLTDSMSDTLHVLQEARLPSLSTEVVHLNQPLLWYTWTWFVSHYSLRKLTQPIDKLLAIAGIAKVFGIIFQDEFVAGLWRKSLMEGLLWYIRRNTCTSTPVEYRAPTWSWASKDGYIMHAQLLEVHKAAWLVARALEVESQVAGTDEMSSTNPAQFGLVSSARLRLQAPCIQTHLTRDNIWVGTNGDYRVPNISVYSDATDYVINPEQIYVGAIIRTTVHRPGTGRRVTLYAQGLILAPASNLPQLQDSDSADLRPKYIRIGHFTAEDRRSRGFRPSWAPSSEAVSIFIDFDKERSSKPQFRFDEASDFLQQFEVI